MTAHTETQAMCERLRSPLQCESTMLEWDNWRMLIKESDGSSLPRDVFEAWLDTVDDEREQAAALLTLQQETIERLTEAAKGSAVIVNVAKEEARHLRSVLRNQTCLLGSVMRTYSKDPQEDYKGLSDFEIAVSPAVRAALQDKPERSPMKHRHKWKPVWQSIRSGVIVAEDCVCECGAKRSEREVSKEATNA